MLPSCRQLHSIISEDEAFAGAALDLVLAMQLAAAGPLWQQLQREGASQADRCGAYVCIYLFIIARVLLQRLEQSCSVCALLSVQAFYLCSVNVQARYSEAAGIVLVKLVHNQTTLL